MVVARGAVPRVREGRESDERTSRVLLHVAGDLGRRRRVVADDAASSASSRVEQRETREREKRESEGSEVATHPFKRVVMNGSE